ncbi:MAG: hypothetical protein ACOCZU_04140 [Planctomycetota bacterium]
MKLRTYRTAVLCLFYAVWLTASAIALAVLGWIPSGWAYLAATILFAGVFLAGTVFALLVNFKMLRITCPFCGQRGRLATENRRYTYFICPRCGEIHPAGPMSRSYVRLGKDLPGNDDGSEGDSQGETPDHDGDKHSS